MVRWARLGGTTQVRHAQAKQSHAGKRREGNCRIVKEVQDGAE